MRKKQAKPAKRLAGVVFPDEDGSGEDSGGSLSPVWHSPSSSSAPDSRIISATERDHSTGNSFRASAMKNAADDNDFHSDAPLLKIPKHEPDNFDSTKTSAADALGELSQLVHRIGTAKLPIPTVPSKCIPNSITSNIFTCLKCAQRFETLDELVLHIRTTKHFTRESIRNFDAVAPWERNRVAANFEKQAASSNFLASLFYAQKCLGVSFALDNFVIFILLKEY
ncbi:unnamed protein product [Onchocerca flexuosa]|uniref:C2H2-type domain-containing protein n=1 Tax=Onchocerca flexuosa TaxID=387005 RepID=A0A183I5J7_9BILA|nr:unnamed protein product [Onchocerca flexuosa]